MSHFTDRLHGKKWGVFTHYLYHEQNNPATRANQGAGETPWSECVDAFKVEALADTLKSVGAGYYFITLMQGRKYLLAPNAAFDRITGNKAGVACARRDLPLELSESLSRRGIDLYLYFTGDGPYKDLREGKAFGFVEPRQSGISADFVAKWSSVLEEYAVHYGDRVKGWWIDGCYRGSFPWGVFNYNDELLRHYQWAVKKGNPKALVTFNDGVKKDLVVDTPIEDYTADEFNDFTVVPESRFLNGVQTHILAPLGVSTDGTEWGSWCKGGLKRTKEYLLDYVRRVNDAGGVVTIDVLIHRDGSLDPEQVEVLKYLGDHLSS